MRNLLLIFMVFCLAVFSVFGQESALYFEVQQAKKANVTFENVTLNKATAEAPVLKNFASPAEVSFFGKFSFDVKNSNSKAINLVMPVGTKNMVLELLEVPESFYDYEVMTSDGKKSPANRDIKHYRGVVKDEESSLVAVTFYKNEIIGIVSTDEGNFNIVKDNKSGKHLFYNERNLKKRPDFECGTVDSGSSFSYDPAVLSMQRSSFTGGVSASQAAVINKEVRFYVETEYDIYQDRGSVSATETFISGLFNQVAVLYRNEDILTSISCMYIWISNDPYTGTNTLDLLRQFQNTRTSIIGDLGVLLTFRPSDGGRAAGYSGLCNASTAQKLSVSMIYNYYSTFPNYSWSVFVIAHEFGHLLGSYHTHDCMWNGNYTAIDGCTNPSGCPNPGIPSNGGTVMSYCHNSSVGINFNLGFGPQPGNVIRNSVNNATCLLACNSPVSFTNQTVTQAVILNSCGTINVQNVTVQNGFSGAKLGLNAKQINIKEPFTVQNGAGLEVKIVP